MKDVQIIPGGKSNETRCLVNGKPIIIDWDKVVRRDEYLDLISLIQFEFHKAGRNLNFEELREIIEKRLEGK